MNHWYVVYKFSGGYGACVVSSDIAWFQIGSTVESLEKSGLDSPIVSSWTLISQEQLEEYARLKNRTTHDGSHTACAACSPNEDPQREEGGP